MRMVSEGEGEGVARMVWMRVNDSGQGQSEIRVTEKRRDALT
jgi:hypothetical protein